MLRSVRGLGMGNAFTAISDDHSAFFYNPAGVTKRKRFTMTLAEIRGTISTDMIDFASWFSDNQDDLKNFEDLSESKKIELLRKISNEITDYNNHLSISAPNFNFIAPLGKLYFGLGVFDDINVKVKMNSGLITPNIDLNVKVDLAGMFLMAYKFSDRFSAGFNAKILARGGIEQNRMSILEFENYEPVIQPGIGIGADIGATYKISNPFSLGFSATDVGGTKIKYEK
ncbi:MAG: DUF5723 family protein, partial [Elusimicrobiota bacterium]|nr:DUF5723 family protein [Elusimicrobiota bacterium]